MAFIEKELLIGRVQYLEKINSKPGFPAVNKEIIKARLIVREKADQLNENDLKKLKPIKILPKGGGEAALQTRL